MSPARRVGARLRTATGIALVLATIVTLTGATLAGCASAPAPSPRSRPDAVERAALAHAGGYFGAAEWIQLWTPRQAGAAITACVNRLSDGLVDAAVEVDTQGGIGVTLSYGLAGASIEDINRFIERKSVQQVVDRCIAATPIDTRVSHLPISSWPALYSYDATTLRRCLISHGQAVDRIPDRALFESLLRAGVAWSPYDHVVVATRADWYALSDACPALPADLARGL